MGLGKGKNNQLQFEQAPRSHTPFMILQALMQENEG